MARLMHVTEYNGRMDIAKLYAMMFTTGNGSMADKPRLKGWVVFESPTLYGDEHDFAKWFPNLAQAKLELKART